MFTFQLLFRLQGERSRLYGRVTTIFCYAVDWTCDSTDDVRTRGCGSSWTSTAVLSWLSCINTYFPSGLRWYFFYICKIPTILSQNDIFLFRVIGSTDLTVLSWCGRLVELRVLFWWCWKYLSDCGVVMCTAYSFGGVGSTYLSVVVWCVEW